MLKNLIFILISFVCLVTCIQAQNLSPDQLGFEAYSFDDPEDGTVNYYVTKTGQDTIKPVLLYLDGSGPIPLFHQIPQGMASTVVIDWQKLQKEFQVLLISKPGIPFVDKVEMDPQRGPQYEAPEEYHERLSLDWRAESADLVIKKLLAEHPNREVIVLGFSEGAQVAANLASKNKEIDYLLLVSGNGLNQLYDFIINARLKAERGQMTHNQAQSEIDSLYRKFKDIYAHPESTTRFWQGHTYKRWASFANNPPVEALTQVDIPIYIANGSRDQNSPVLNTDYMKLQFQRLGKKNITYRVYPGYDHQFNEHVFENGQFKQAIPRLRNEVLTDAFTWLNRKRSNRE